MSVIHSQSPDIDQGMMFGFACTETPQLMPAPESWIAKAVELKAAVG